MSAAALAFIGTAVMFGGEAHASEAAFYAAQNSDQTSETVKRIAAGDITEAPVNVTEAPVKEDITDPAAQGQEGNGTEEGGQGNTSQPTPTPSPTSHPTATPTPYPTANPTVAPTPVPTAAPHVHSYTATVTQAATCIANGVMTYTCSCGSSYTESIPATGHNYVQTGATGATCTTNGSVTYTCANCGGTKSDTILATGHVWTDLTQQVYVVDQQAWDEEVVTYQQEVHAICSTCGFDFTAAGYSQSQLDAHSEAHALALEGGGWYTAVVQIPVTSYVHHDEVGHYETVVVGQVCAVCGATQ